jgi:hypothetical protein
VAAAGRGPWRKWQSGASAESVSASIALPLARALAAGDEILSAASWGDKRSFTLAGQALHSAQPCYACGGDNQDERARWGG